MFLPRLFALLSISYLTIRCVGVVSYVVIGLLIFSSYTVAAAECDTLVDITKASSSTAASQQNFRVLLGCVKQLQEQQQNTIKIIREDLAALNTRIESGNAVSCVTPWEVPNSIS